MDVVSLCPFAAGAVAWEPQPGERSLTVLVKATFSLVPGEACVASSQDRLCEERYCDDDGLASLHFPGDFAPSKRRVDVTLVGHAYAPGGAPTTSLVAKLTVGDLRKAVRVTGDRSWARDAAGVLAPSAPAPFTRMPLRYERAELGDDNPVGVDPSAPPATPLPALPNLERADRDPAVPCFGPLAPTWRARRRLLDEPAASWAWGVGRDPRDARALGPAPLRFDFAFFNAAPADQQIDLLRPGTPIVLENMHPDHARLETRLPPIRPQVFRVPPAGDVFSRTEEIILRCDSLWIDTDRSVAVVTWRGVADGPALGRLVVVADPEGKRLRWDRVAKQLASDDAHGSGEEAPPDPLAVRHDAVKSRRDPS